MSNTPSASIFFGVRVGDTEDLVGNDGDYVDSNGAPLEDCAETRTEIVRSLTWDYGAVFVAIAESVVTAHGDMAEPIQMIQDVPSWRLQVAPDWDARLRTFCKKHHVTFADGRWLLVSFYG